MNNLFVFGDSFSLKNYESYGDYINFKGYTPKMYHEQIAEKLNLKLDISAYQGCDNYTIFEYFIEKIDKIKKDDYVIFNWTDISRFRLVQNDGTWIVIYPYMIDYTDFNGMLDDIDKKAMNQICLNRNNDLFINEINSYIKLINTHLKNNKVIHWSWINYKNKMKLSLPYEKLETIFEETGGVINDNHYSENGNYLLSEKIIKLL
jgi:hypothetical protein